MAEKKYFNLTNPQQNIMEVEKLLLTRCNHILASVKFANKLDINRLKKTINKMIELNDSFQIKLVERNGTIEQTFVPYQEQEIEVVYDIKNLDKYLQELNREHIDIYDKLFEFKLLVYKGQTYVLYKGHHIVNDAWGVTQIAEQIKEIYPIIKDFDNYEITKPSYIDAIEYETKYLTSERYEKDKIFWKEYVKKLSTEKVFNRDVSDIEAKRIKKILNTKTYTQVQKYCKKNNISEYVFFLTILSVYFLKIYNVENLNVGTPFLNRTKEQMESIALFITNLPLNVQIRQDQSFGKLCSEVYSDSMKVFRRSKFPYKEIQKLYSTINTSSNLFEVGYSYQINKLDNKLNGYLGEATWYFSEAQNNPITVHVSRIDTDLEIFYDYITSVIPDTNIELMHNIVLHIINQVIKSKTDINISEINVIPLTEKNKLVKFNNTGKLKIKPKTISNMMDEVSKKYAKKEAVKFKNQSLKYSEFHKKVTDLATQLRGKGVKRNVPVLLFFDKSLEMIISMFAVIKAGGCYVPVLPDENPDRIKYIMNDCNPAYILTSSEYEKTLDGTNIIVVEEKKLGKRENKLENINSHQDILYIIYTSGSTGNPKGTKVTHENVFGLNYSMLGDTRLKPTESDVSMSLLKYSFDASGIDIYSALLNGGKLLLISKEDELNPEKVVKIMEKEKVSRSFLVPKWLEHINLADKNVKVKLSQLKILGTGGEVFKPKVVENLFQKYPSLKIVNLYGPTEATMFATVTVINRDDIEKDYVSIGKPIKYSRAYLLNSSNDILPTNVQGELFLAQDMNSIRNIAQGYLNLDHITESKFIELYDPINQGNKIKGYKTGDIVRINNKLDLEFIGRSDDIIKVNNGYLVSINEVEKKVNDIIGSKYVTCVIPINVGTTKALTVFVESLGAELDARKVKEEINSSISFYMRIKEVFILEKFPLNNSGKVDRNALKERAGQKTLTKEIIIPETETEQNLYDIIKKQSDLAQFSIFDDFIDDLNIDSLDLSVIYSLIDNKNLKMQDLYTYTTVRDLAKYIDDKKKVKVKKTYCNIQIIDDVKPFDLNKVLLLGSTGFLGVHILADLLLNKKIKKVFCLVRGRGELSAEDRLYEKLKYYFNDDEELIKQFENKVEILEGDINSENYGLDIKQYHKLQREVTTLINSAASVAHYGKYEAIYDTNVTSVKSLIEFCGKKISLAHVSTLSVAGFKDEKTEKKVFDENTLYIKQSFHNNPYLITKFEAEQLILESDINAKIYRLGNIMPRNTDGKFQDNYKQNAFINAIRLILKLKKVPSSYLKFKVEFSPVEECAKAIMGTMLSNCENKTYHIINENELEIEEVLNSVSGGDEIEVVSDEEFMSSLKNYKEVGVEYVKEYIVQSNTNEYSTLKTRECLDQAGFSWSKTDKKYLENLLRIIKKDGW